MIAHVVAVVVAMTSMGGQVADRQNPDTGQSEAELRMAENARRQAILQNDARALDTLLAQEFTSIGSLNAGRVTSKAEELAFNAAVTRRVQSWLPRDEQFRIYGNVGVVTGLAEVTDILRGDRRHLIFQYTDIWLHRSGRWQLVHRHTNRVATLEGPAPPPAIPPPI